MTSRFQRMSGVDDLFAAPLNRIFHSHSDPPEATVRGLEIAYGLAAYVPSVTRDPATFEKASIHLSGLTRKAKAVLINAVRSAPRPTRRRSSVTGASRPSP